MSITGQRHAYKAVYKCGFSREGPLRALDLRVYSNGGCSLDTSIPILERTLLHCDNIYQFHNMKLSGRVCKINLPSNTGMRGFGGPQGLMICEIILDQVASYVNIEPSLIRQRNLYKENEQTYFKQRLRNWNIPKMWNQLLETASYQQSLTEIEIFNRNSLYHKRGISVIGTKFDIGFHSAKFLHQAGALIHLYKDGSILLTHGGVEMGQSLHTKMIQICAELLKIDMSLIRISETSTDKIPNTSPTAASLSSDLYGMAISNACQQLNERLQPLRDKHPTSNWSELIENAYYNRINLSAQGFYSTPNIVTNFDQNHAEFNYFTQGVGCSEVEVDCLTGDFITLRTDILMDLGQSLNPKIDIEQIEVPTIVFKIAMMFGTLGVSAVNKCSKQTIVAFRSGRRRT
ncbi:unnamed protein product [Didymodactylos carnosus]|uniref:Xanthine dehydrogenase n=1 Tax=Didymodactylos carnosus TaxID=1234261 RepID=A0A815TKU9_9BILA|nr:unnamed protein product [Didymodactylos carnosus]CAF1504353.1 unnamed protein product [Didymodactylos carnosus]CAF4144707.1 unnamed protein product [Didymodactylos carnosus]CAF4365743.1 unnamed protein product [Didymodactylos carnosus]